MTHEDQIEFYKCPICDTGFGNDVDRIIEEHKCPVDKMYTNHMTYTEKRIEKLRQLNKAIGFTTEEELPVIEHFLSESIRGAVATAGVKQALCDLYATHNGGHPNLREVLSAVDKLTDKEIEEMPQMKGTLEALDKLTINKI